MAEEITEMELEERKWAARRARHPEVIKDPRLWVEEDGTLKGCLLSALAEAIRYRVVDYGDIDDDEREQVDRWVAEQYALCAVSGFGEEAKKLLEVAGLAEEFGDPEPLLPLPPTLAL